MILTGDCRAVLPTLNAESVDAVVTDPPYGLKFMGKDWDHGIPGVHFWQEILRVAKPGAHLVAFGGTRTFHRLTCAIEDAGWEIRDTLCWLYGQGFPKSLDVSKAIDKAAGVTRERRLVPTKPGNLPEQAGPISLGATGMHDDSVPITDAAREWSGWGTALKPAFEPIILARKPIKGTVAANVQKHGTGAINVDGCRIGWAGPEDVAAAAAAVGFAESRARGAAKQSVSIGKESRDGVNRYEPDKLLGRWPANLVLDEEAAAMLDEQSGERNGGGYILDTPHASIGFGGDDGKRTFPVYPDSGGASRFFYTAKASSWDRNDGIDGTRKVIYTDPVWANAVLAPRLRAATGTSPEKVIAGSTIHGTDGSAWSTCWCGSLSTDPFHPDTASTIKTATSSTTGSKTFGRSVRPHTNGCMAAVFGAMANGGSPAACAESSSPWERRTGISVEKDGLFTEDADLATSVASWLKKNVGVPGEGGGHRVRAANSHPT
jgi:site-specific DNA-methyltransferase (adenine-specific)